MILGAFKANIPNISVENLESGLNKKRTLEILKLLEKEYGAKKQAQPEQQPEMIGAPGLIPV